MPTIAFAGAALDRADHLRHDPAALAALVPAGRLLRLDGIDARIEQGGLGWGVTAEAAGAELIFLGIDGEGRGCFAAAPAAGSASVGPANPRLWARLTTLSPGDLGTYGLARSLAGWHARHRFCAQCGAPTALARGGWQRDCTNPECRAQHFPRTDPVSIMLVEHEGDVLLGRQPRFPARQYSALAGFIEPGESIEEAVAREVFEEAGVRVGRVNYVASQPWPFPSSLMIACYATALGREIAVDRTELEDARWFTRAEVEAAMAARAEDRMDAPLIVPPSYAVAWHLLDWWLKR